jgi:VWFA-related protein
VRTNLVLVPVLVKNKSGEPVYSLTAQDFVLTDDGVPQSVQLELDTDSQPLALAVIVQTGGQGAQHLGDYHNLGTLLDAVIGNVSHHVAVIEFDSKPRLKQDFTNDTDAAARMVEGLQRGDGGAAILDALDFGIGQLRNQPPIYRRAVLLFSESIDSGSQISVANAIREIDDTNTEIYSFTFSSTRTGVTHEASKMPRPGGSSYMDEPYAPGGCMSKDPNADPDAHGNRSVQALDCASDLLPPLRLARMAFIAASDGLKQNAPRSVARLTGGEYFAFSDAKDLRLDLIKASHDVPSYYVLSFRPRSPGPGLHALDVGLKEKPRLRCSSRKAYWVDVEARVDNK